MAAPLHGSGYFTEIKHHIEDPLIMLKNVMWILCNMTPFTKRGYTHHPPPAATQIELNSVGNTALILFLHTHLTHRAVPCWCIASSPENHLSVNLISTV